MTAADEIQDFTEQEFEVICGACIGLSNLEIANQRRIAENAVQETIGNIFNKLRDVSNRAPTRFELRLFARAALNAELLRRSGR